MPTPTGNENMTGALTMAQSICWDESHGYSVIINGQYITGRQLNPDVDCSALVCHCLNQNGFDIAEWGDTNTIINTLSNYQGFYHQIFDPYSTPLQNGDILVSEGSGSNAHTFFYAENVIGYASADSAQTSLLQSARIEASSSRGLTTAGDSQKNGTGAYWEVWVHAYGWDYTDTRVWHLFRWSQSPQPQVMEAWLYSKFNKKRRYKDYDFNY